MDESNSTPTAADRERAQPHDCWCGMWPLYPNIDSLDDGSKKHTRTFCGTFAEAVAALTALAAAREAAEAEREEARAELARLRAMLAAERAACATLCDEQSERLTASYVKGCGSGSATRAIWCSKQFRSVAAAIRAREATP